MTSDVIRGGITLPRSSPRARDGFVKLLFSVDPDAVHGFGFDGIFFKAGSVVTPAQLRPEPCFPEIPILLEFASGEAQGPPGRRRREGLYILWRLDWETNAWRELGRAASESWEWAIDLRPLAVRALREARQTALVEITADLPAIARRIAHYLDSELRPLEPVDRVRVIGVLHDEFARKLVA